MSIDERAYWDCKAKRVAQDSKVTETATEKLMRLRRDYILYTDAFTGDAAQAAAVRAEIDRLNAEAQTAEDAIWTKEETMARREKWNAAARSGNYTTRTGGALLGKLEGDMGFRATTLKRHIQRHGL